MKSSLFHGIMLFLVTISLTAQDIIETNTDIIYEQALAAYQDSRFQESLSLTQRGLELAPEYHDIRILQVRNLWALGNFAAADKNLHFLLAEAPGYVDVKPLVYQRINRFTEDETALEFVNNVEETYRDDTGLQVRKAQLLLKLKRRSEARSLAMDLISKSGISGEDRYALQIVLNRSVKDEVGVNYQYIGFSDDYPRNDAWHSISGEYQHNFNRTAVIGRITYSDRGYDDGSLYEIEAYPVFSDRFYAFTNLGFSSGEIFPDFRSSLSLFYNFAKIFEAEAGGRLLNFNGNNYFTGIAGVTMYQGKFYFNIRTFLGPERGGQLDQNLQANLRYYFQNADNYYFLRLGSGISPDERTLFTQVQENPGLEVYYGNLGINFTAGVHHIFQVSGGVLKEDVSSEIRGTQLLGNVMYRYRF